MTDPLKLANNLPCYSSDPRDFEDGKTCGKCRGCLAATALRTLQAENERLRERLTVIEGMLDRLPDAYQPAHDVAREYQAWADALDTELCNLKADEDEQ